MSTMSKIALQESSTKATAILTSLQHHNLTQWGFLIIRTTYTSQPKWDRFMTLMKSHAADFFSTLGKSDIYALMAWTTIEDPDSLNGVDMATTAEKFTSWVNGPEGRRDREGSVFDTPGALVGGPRYTFFLHVDEESLESVVDDEQAREPGGYFCKVVRAELALPEEGGEEHGDEEGEERDEEEVERDLLDVRKRVPIDKIVQLYALLLNTNLWYNIWIEDGVAQL